MIECLGDPACASLAATFGGVANICMAVPSSCIEATTHSEDHNRRVTVRHWIVVLRGPLILRNETSGLAAPASRRHNSADPL